MENSSFEFKIAIFIHLKINRKLLGIRRGHTAAKVNILFENSTCPELYEKLRDWFYRYEFRLQTPNVSSTIISLFEKLDLVKWLKLKKVA